MNEMRLVEVAARRCNICPIGRGTVSRHVNGPLKTLHTTEQLRGDADLIEEYLDKMPLAQPEMRGKVSNLRFACPYRKPQPALTYLQLERSSAILLDRPA